MKLQVKNKDIYIAGRDKFIYVYETKVFDEMMPFFTCILWKDMREQFICSVFLGACTGSGEIRKSDFNSNLETKFFCERQYWRINYL